MNEPLSAYYIFHEVASCQNISRASAKLYVSQPAISKSIQKLEESLGVKLFVRGSKGVSLTEDGELLYASTQTAFSSLDQARNLITQRNALESGTLRIGVSSTLCKNVLLPYLEQYIHSFPHVRVSISCQSTGATLRMIDDHQIDVGLICRPKHTEHLCYDRLREVEDTFICTPSYLERLKLHGSPVQSTNDVLSCATLMLLDRENLTRQYIDRYLAQQQIIPADIIDVSDMNLLIEFARIGLGVACVIKDFVKDDLENGTLVALPLDEPIRRRQIGFAYKKMQLQNPALERLLQLCLE